MRLCDVHRSCAPRNREALAVGGVGARIPGRTWSTSGSLQQPGSGQIARDFELIGIVLIGRGADPPLLSPDYSWEAHRPISVPEVGGGRRPPSLPSARDPSPPASAEFPHSTRSVEDPIDSSDRRIPCPNTSALRGDQWRAYDRADQQHGDSGHDSRGCVRPIGSRAWQILGLHRNGAVMIFGGRAGIYSVSTRTK